MVPQFRQICLVSVVVLLEGLSLAGMPAPAAPTPRGGIHVFLPHGDGPAERCVHGPVRPRLLGHSQLGVELWRWRHEHQPASRPHLYSDRYLHRFPHRHHGDERDGGKTRLDHGRFTRRGREGRKAKAANLKGKARGPVEGALEEGEMEGQKPKAVSKERMKEKAGEKGKAKMKGKGKRTPRCSNNCSVLDMTPARWGPTWWPWRRTRYGWRASKMAGN